MLWTVFERMKEDNEVAVADTVKMMRVRRPQIIPTLVMLYTWANLKVGQGVLTLQTWKH